MALLSLFVFVFVFLCFFLVFLAVAFVSLFCVSGLKRQLATTALLTDMEVDVWGLPKKGQTSTLSASMIVGGRAIPLTTVSCL